MAILAPENGLTSQYNPLLISTQEQWRFVAQNTGMPGLTSLVDQALRNTWAAPFEALDPFPFESPGKLKTYSSSGDVSDQAQGMFGTNVYAIRGSLLQSPTPPPTNGGASGGGGAPPPTDPVPLPPSPSPTPSPTPSPAAGGAGFLWALAIGVGVLSGMRR